MPSVYKDYAKTKANILSLKEYIDAYVSEKVLTHIDAVPGNFLFIEKDGQEEIRLIDWEYYSSDYLCGIYIFFAAWI